MAQRIPLHHGQLRVTVQRSRVGVPDESVRAIFDAEAESELLSEDACRRFASHAREIRKGLTETLQQLHDEGQHVVGYGAPAKGNTLLSFLELGTEQLPYIADRSALKQGRFAPGSHIPIVSPERIFQDQPDYVLILAWNFVDEIVQQLSAYQHAGGKFILPVPQVQII